jgi:hypothetical protein
MPSKIRHIKNLDKDVRCGDNAQHAEHWWGIFGNLRCDGKVSDR